MADLNKIHRAIFGKDRHLVTPVCVSEMICKHFLELNDYNGKKFDAQDAEGKTYEIKATSSKNGVTTISSAQPDYLVWVLFDYDANKLVIKRIPFNKVSMAKTVENEAEIKDQIIDDSDQSSDNDRPSERHTITLSKVFNDDNVDRIIQINMDTLEVIQNG